VKELPAYKKCMADCVAFKCSKMKKGLAEHLKQVSDDRGQVAADGICSMWCGEVTLHPDKAACR